MALCSPALIYVIYRAAILDFTYDECWTYLGYAQAPIQDVLLNTYPAANNHVLHSLLMKCSALLFGNAPFALRIPVLLAFLAYCYAVVRIVMATTTKFGLPVFIGLIYQPYLLDYFSMARGYGIALAATLVAVLALEHFLINHKPSELWKGAIALLVASWANFAFLLPAFAWWGLLTLIVFKLRVTLRTYLSSFLAFIAASLVLFTSPIRQLIESNELYYGADAFFSGTLQSILARLFYQIEIGVLPTLGFSIVLIFMLILTIVAWLKSKKPDLATISFSIVALSFAGNWLQHIITGAPYLIDRTAIFSIPLLILALPMLFAYFKPGLAKFVSFALSTLFIVNLALAFNVTYFLDFKSYADTEKAMVQIKALTNGKQHGEVVIGKSTYMNATINYYKDYLEMPQIAHSTLAYCNEQARYNFYYLFEKDLVCVDEINVDTLAYFEVSRTYLFHLNEEGPTM